MVFYKSVIGITDTGDVRLRNRAFDRTAQRTHGIHYSVVHPYHTTDYPVQYQRTMGLHLMRMHRTPLPRQIVLEDRVPSSSLSLNLTQALESKKRAQAPDADIHQIGRGM
jgi:hypothetical protein